MLRDPTGGLVDDLFAWQQSTAVPPTCRDCLYRLLDGRSAYGGRPDATRWRAGDVRSLLLDTAVTRLTARCDLPAHGPTAITDLLRYLGDTDRFHPASASTTTLLAEAREAAPQFPAALADRSRWRLAKSFYEAMLDDGVDIDDAAAVDDWAAAFSLRPPDERRLVLGHLADEKPQLLVTDFIARDGKVAALPPRKAGDPVPSSRPLADPGSLDEPLRPFAPVPVPTTAQAAQAARQSPLLHVVLTVARWLAAGRRATKDGLLVPAEVEALARVTGEASDGERVRHLSQAPWAAQAFAVAGRLELARLTRHGWRAGPRLEGWADDDALVTASDDDVVELWDDVFTIVEHRLAPRALEHRDPAQRQITEQMDEWAAGITPALVLDLYRRVADDEGPADVAELTTAYVPDHSVVGAVDDEEVPDVLARLLATVLGDQLLQLGDLGAVAFSGPGVPAMEAALAERAGTSRATARLLRPIVLSSCAEVVVSLTPIALRSVRQTLLSEGVQAPAG